MFIRLDIEDNGIGISEEEIPKIFGTTIYDKNTDLRDTYFLTKEEAEKAIAELKKKYIGE